MQDFYFEDWAELYQRDPIEFSRKRKQVLTAMIERAPLEQRPMLRLLQMECDVAHETMDPLAATAEMTQMMIHKLNQLVEPLSALKEELDKINR